MSKKVRVLVTGGAGFIGSHLVDRLVEKDYDVRVIDNLSTGNLANIKGHVKSGTVEFVEGDIRSEHLVAESVKDVEVVFHLAAVTSVPYSVEHPDVTYDVNLAGTLNLLRTCVSAGVQKFVFISSCAVYGDSASLPIDESVMTCPISPYALSKLAGEQCCLGFDEKEFLSVTVFRLFNVYGPRQGLNDYSGVITKFFDRAKKGLPLIVYGDGLQTRDFVNVHDVVRVVLSSIGNEGARGEIFNIGFGKPVSINELAKTVSDLSGLNLMINHEPARTGEIKYSYADISKAKTLLGYEPAMSLSNGLRDLLAEESLPEECPDKQCKD